MLDWLNEVDTNIFLFFNSMRCGFFDYFFHSFSGRWVWIPMYAAILYTFFRSFNWRQAVIFVLCVALTIVVTDQIGASLLRPIFERPRPSNPASPISNLAVWVEWYRPGGYGFPSCHAANTVALATIVSLWLRRKGVTLFMFLWAIVTCYSRIYLAAHYPGDLVAGAFLGGLVAWAVYCFSRWVNKKAASRFYRDSEHPVYGGRALGFFYPSYAIIIVGVLTVLILIVTSAWKSM